MAGGSHLSLTNFAPSNRYRSKVLRFPVTSLSRTSGGAKNPTFRQVILYARGYGVTLEELALFFNGDEESADAN